MLVLAARNGKSIFLKNLFIAIICSLVGFLTAYNGVFFDIDMMISDNIYQKPKVPNSSIYVIGIDEKTLDELGQFGTWSRDISADIIRQLNSNPDAKPAAIGMDIMYFGESDEQSDQNLADAAEKGGNVVVASQISFKKDIKADKNGQLYFDESNIEYIEQPYDALKNVTTQGHISTLPENDGIIRYSIHQAKADDMISYSFGYELYKKFAQSQDQTKKLPHELNPKLDVYGRFYIPFSGNPGDFYGGNSFIDVLNGTIPPEVFADSIVIVGPYASGMLDDYYTSIERSTKMNGCEIHANIVQSLIEQNYKQFASPLLQAIVLSIIIFIAYFSFLKLDFKFSLVLMIGVSALYIVSTLIFYQNGTVLSMIYLPLAMILLYVYRLIFNYFSERAMRKEVTDTFKKYVAPQVVDKIIKDGSYATVLGGANRDIAVLFADVRGFTPMSETLEPEKVVEVLNRYLELTTQAIFSNGGTLDKFIGDSTMAMFNAPFDQADYVYKAVCAAVEMSKTTEAIAGEILNKYGKTVGLGIGVNCGPAIVGNIGTHNRLDYTCIGDTVNTAARLESNAKRGQVLISRAVYERIQDKIKVTELGEIPLKGKSTSIFVYSVDEIL